MYKQFYMGRHVCRNLSFEKRSDRSTIVCDPIYKQLSNLDDTKVFILTNVIHKVNTLQRGAVSPVVGHSLITRAARVRSWVQA